MPLYEFRCRVCSDTFAVDRPMSRSSDPAVCPDGHEDTVRLLTIGAAVTSSSPGRTGGFCPEPADPPCGAQLPGNGCGGGACAMG